LQTFRKLLEKHQEEGGSKENLREEEEVDQEDIKEEERSFLVYELFLFLFYVFYFDNLTLICIELLF
jgi:hypothetical protein